MNVHESGKISRLFDIGGYQKVDSAEQADIIVFNTCCIRNTAEQKIISHIGETKRMKGKTICVVGCLSQRDAGKLKKKFPHIRVILGTHNIDKIVDAVKCNKTFIEVLEERESGSENSSGNMNAVKTKRPNANNEYEDSVLQSRGQDKNPVSYVNITYGCENFCSYCIVPYVRGKLICRDSQIIEDEFRTLLDGYYDKQNNNILSDITKGRVIYLLGQNVNSYVCPRTGMDFPRLLEKLCALEGNFKLNFLSSHPKDFSGELVDVISRNLKIERNIHLPMQSGCDRILALMNRKYTVAEYTEKINLLRKCVPDVHITTDIICGFPTETHGEFLQTMETVKKLQFNAAFIFPYSRRSGTAADKMEGQIDSKTKNARATELIKVQREISIKIADADSGERE